MAPSFDSETPVLWYGPRPHDHGGGRNERAWVFWPAWAFRVIAPEFRDRRVNVLQKAVLGLLRASRLTAEEIGGRLGVHAELAAFVVSELQTQGRVDTRGVVTKAGEELLDAEEDESANLVPAWVFRDPWKQDLWPYVARTLERARTIWDDARFPALDLGTTGRPWQQHAWAEIPKSPDFPAPPTAEEILKASVRSGRLARRAKRLRSWSEDDEPVVDVDRLRLARVSVVEPKPEPVFLTTYLYVPDGDVEEARAGWYACDFFGRGASADLRRLIDRVSRESDGLTREIGRMLGRRLGIEADEVRRIEDMRRSKAALLVEQSLTADIRRFGVAEPLEDAVDAWLEIDPLADRAPARKLRDVLSACRRALERLFVDLAAVWPLRGISDRLGNDGDVNAEKIRAAGALVGLRCVPEVLCRVGKRLVKSVSDYSDAWRLRPLVVATVLRASEESGHPLRAAAAAAPDLLERLERVVSRAGEAGHDSPDEHFSAADVAACLDEVLVIAGFVLGLPTRTLEEIRSYE